MMTFYAPPSHLMNKFYFDYIHMYIYTVITEIQEKHCLNSTVKHMNSILSILKTSYHTSHPFKFKRIFCKNVIKLR